MIGEAPPVQIPPLPQMVEQVYVQEEREEIIYCKDYQECQTKQKEHGGIISTNGTDFMLIFIPKERLIK